MSPYTHQQWEHTPWGDNFLWITLVALHPLHWKWTRMQRTEEMWISESSLGFWVYAFELHNYCIFTNPQLHLRGAELNTRGEDSGRSSKWLFKVAHCLKLQIGAAYLHTSSQSVITFLGPGHSRTRCRIMRPNWLCAMWPGLASTLLCPPHRSSDAPCIHISDSSGYP